MDASACGFCEDCAHYLYVSRCIVVPRIVLKGNVKSIIDSRAKIGLLRLARAWWCCCTVERLLYSLYSRERTAADMVGLTATARLAGSRELTEDLP